MTEPNHPTGQRYPGSDDLTDAEIDRGSTTKRPRWVSVLWTAIVIALLLLLVILHITGILGARLHGG